jgi:hypothetical protein
MMDIRRERISGAVTFGLGLALATAVPRADAQAPSPAPPPAQPAAAGDGGLRPLCTDRPTQSTSPCTVDKGHVQLESDLFNATYDRSGGQVVDTYLATDPTLKYGLDDNTDVEAQISPYEIVRTHTPGGDTQQLSGVSDLVLRLKHNLTDNRSEGWGVALDPFLQLPTGRSGIGDGGVEGGLLVPFQTNVTKTVTFGGTPEIDVRRNMTGGGVHTVEVEVANFGIQLPANLTFSPEIYVAEDQDPAGAVTRCSGDVSLAWMATKDLQLDVGANIGLNPQTPAVQAYFGVSHRF